MAGKPGLRAVKSDESAPKSAPKSVAQAAKGGNPRELLVAMRDRIAVAISGPDCQPRDLASLTKRLQDIAHDIDGIDAREDVDAPGRLRELESALRAVVPDHPLLSGTDAVDDRFDASAI